MRARLMIAQFPVKDVKELEAQLVQIQEQLHEGRDKHEGKSAEEVYANRLSSLSLTEGGPQTGETVVKALLARCLLWCEIIQEKYAPHFGLMYLAQQLISSPITGKASSTPASKTPTTNSTNSATNSSK